MTARRNPRTRSAGSRESAVPARGDVGTSAKANLAVTANDQAMMKVALRLARRGDGRVFPNPSVGAVIYRGDEILGRGRTQPPGGAHAEVSAIADAVRRVGADCVRGASIAVTLEPCSFQGRTGPCTEALLDAGLSRVLAGCRDPHPKVAGKGFARLRRAGVGVVTGVEEEACLLQHRGFISVCERKRPWITLKLGTSLDGRSATASGESRWITSADSRRFVHRLRDEHDAILVGSETVLADDPDLSVRRGEQVIRSPIRVVVDSRLRIPSRSRILSRDDVEKTWVLTRKGVRGEARVRATGAKVLAVPAGRAASAGGRIDLRRAMTRIAKEGLTRVLVEGGGGLAAALMRADLIDEVHWMLAPRLLGSDGCPALGPLELGRLADAVELDPIDVMRRGVDLHLHGFVQRDVRTKMRKKGRKS